MAKLNFGEFNLLPDKEDENIRRTIDALGISESPFYVDLAPEPFADNGFCFENVLTKVGLKNGEMVVGWQFAEFSFMIEAEFHAIWKSPQGNLSDITQPPIPGFNNKILFVIDPTRKWNGKRVDNFRYNITGNALIDDMIEIEKAKFRLNERIRQAEESGEIVFLNADFRNSEMELNLLSHTIDEMCRYNGTVNSSCFCQSGFSYKNCHRQKVLEYLYMF